MNIRRHLQIDERRLVVEHYEQVKSLRKVANMHGISQEGVRKIIGKYNVGKPLQDMPRTGRPRKTTERVDRTIVRKFKENPKLTTRNMQENLCNIGINVCKNTISNRLHDANLFSRVARKKPLLQDRHKKARLEFALKYVNKSAEFWRKVI